MIQVTLILNGLMLLIRKIIPFFVLLVNPLFGVSITLYNNSVFPLIADIYDARGNLLTSIKVRAGQTHIWGQNSDSSPFAKQPNRTYTPYTVRWVCQTQQPYDYSAAPKNKKQKAKKKKYVSEYGSWNNVARGSLVSALEATSGTKTCVIRKKDKKGTQPHTPASKDRENSGFNNFSNDGGQTWTNDGGWPGIDDQVK